MTSLSQLLVHLPRPLHRAALRLAQRLRALRRAFTTTSVPGCAMIVNNAMGHVMLVRHSYVEPETWMLPAGKLDRGEAPLAAARRELREEVGCVLHKARILEFEDTRFWGRTSRTFIVGGFSAAVPMADGREIEEAAFFPLWNLPESVSEPTLVRLQRWELRGTFPLEVPAFIRLEYVQARYTGRISRARELESIQVDCLH
jgi:8-oxo-dGTP pyrophosphatase MutT (NUDIX family)